jgi:hypothetical protein
LLNIFEGGSLLSYCTVLISQKKPLCPPQKVQLDLSFARSIQKLLQLNRWCFGLGLGIIKTWEAKNSKFPDLLWRTRHLKSADFSTLKFQVLIVRLSQDLDSVHIFESEDHLDNRKKKNWSLFYRQTRWKRNNSGHRDPRFWLSVYFWRWKPPRQQNQNNLSNIYLSNVSKQVKFSKLAILIVETQDLGYLTLIPFGKFEDITVLMAKTCYFDSKLECFQLIGP